MSQNVNSIQPNPSDERHHKNMYIIAGCNGAGKTTAFRRELSAQLGNPQFVNPDVNSQGCNVTPVLLSAMFTPIFKAALRYVFK